MSKFEIGERVKMSFGGADEDDVSVMTGWMRFDGSCGTVIGVPPLGGMYAIEFDEADPTLHDCNNLGEPSHCLYVPESLLTLIEEGVECKVAVNIADVEPRELTDEEMETLVEECRDLFDEYDIDYDDRHIEAFLREWWRNKGKLVSYMEKHPMYNGKYQIAFANTFDRVTDKNGIARFVGWMSSNMKYDPLVKTALYKEASYKQWRSRYSLCSQICDLFRYNDNAIHTVNDHDREYWIKAKDDADSALYWFRDNSYDWYGDNNNITMESYEKIVEIGKFFRFLKTYFDCKVDQELVDRVNKIDPSIRPAVGQKTSRLVNKVCSKLGLDKVAGYNSAYASYADSINPMQIKRFTVLSAHPIDYLTMSFGINWASCHTIDKSNKRHMPNAYEGQYSAGTMSYMLDGTSLVFYTVMPDGNENCLELEPKVNRNMFHIGENKIIQGRVYPQDNDGENSIYKDFREIVQKIFADLWEVPNLWKNEKGTRTCDSVTRSYGSHYRDYCCYGNCNVSFLSGDFKKNMNRIDIGHNAICPNCGDWHNYSESVMCEDCYSGEHRCGNCGALYGEEDMYLINGNWYCSDCVTYCEYHERYEADCDHEFYYVHNYGNICDDAALYSGDFARCESCGEVFDMRDGDYICAEDGTGFCCIDCAESHGYLYVESEAGWYSEDEVVTCPECGEIVLNENFDDDLNMCNDCAKHREEEGGEE